MARLSARTAGTIEPLPECCGSSPKRRVAVAKSRPERQVTGLAINRVPGRPHGKTIGFATLTRLVPLWESTCVPWWNTRGVYVVSEFISSAEAFRIARERASVAAVFEASTLHLAVFDAREAGLSVRETSVALSVPESTVAHHWREVHHCAQPLPVWGFGSVSTWREAHAAVWAHNPGELAGHWVP